MKRLTLFFFMIAAAHFTFAQAPLQLNFQGVARNAQGNALINQSIQVRLSIHDLSPTGMVVYSESRSTTTNPVGIFNVIIGSKGAMTYQGTLEAINWGLGDKYLQLEFDPTGNGAYVDLGTTQFQSVPYALNAYTATPIGNAAGDLTGVYPKPRIASGVISTEKLADFSVTDVKISNINGAKVFGDITGNATNVNGVVAISNGGTGANTLNVAKLNLGINEVDNTRDIYKPISNPTQTALNRKLNVADTVAMLAPYAKSELFNSTLNQKMNIADTTLMLSFYARKAALDSKAANMDLLLKAPLASPTFTGTVSGITSIMVGLGNVNNTSDANKPISVATQTALDAKASNSDLALKAPLASPTFTGTVSGITSTMVGLGNVNNTSDANKPISTLTQTALDLKAPLSSPTFTGTLTASYIVKTGGTSLQYLMADGSTSSGTAPVREVADEFSATASQTSFTLTHTPSANSKVQMYINGIRISNTSYFVSGTTLTYIPANNSAYALSLSDRIQFDYYY